MYLIERDDHMSSHFLSWCMEYSVSRVSTSKYQEYTKKSDRMTENVIPFSLSLSLFLMCLGLVANK